MARSGADRHGSQHVNFIGADGHVHELYIHPGAVTVQQSLSSSLHLRSEAGDRNVSRARKGAVAQNGTAASNSLSRMPGSWSGINNPTGFEVGRKCSWL